LDEHCPPGISRFRAIRAIFCCSSLRAGSVSLWHILRLLDGYPFSFGHSLRNQ
jgi:hypothetical protein